RAGHHHHPDRGHGALRGSGARDRRLPRRGPQERLRPGHRGLTAPHPFNETSRMAIKVPGKRYGKRLRKSKVFGGGPPGGKGANNVDLNMTPLVDMFVIMVLFLIANFSATGEIINQSQDIELPEAKHVEGLQLTTVIRVSMTDIYVETDPIAKVSDVLGEEYLNIPALEEKLRTVKADCEKLHASTGKEFTGDINIQAHKDL